MSIRFEQRPDWKLVSRLYILIVAVTMGLGSIVAGASERQVFRGSAWRIYGGDGNSGSQPSVGDGVCFRA